MMVWPSKKVLSIFVVTAALVASIIITFGKDKTSSAVNFANNLVVGDKVSIPENPNWQGELGVVGDGVEQVQKESTTTEETTTDVVSRALISNYLALKQSGALNSTSAQKLIDQTVNLADQLGDKFVLETKLNIVPDNGKQSITDYGENLGNVLRNNKPQKIADEREIINTAVSTLNQSKINELDSIIAVYEKIANDLIKMPVPQTFVKAHLDMTNGAKSMAIALTEIKTVFNDPMKSLSSMQLYQKGMTIFMQAKQATDTFIIKNNVVYKQGSGGYYLLYGI